VDHPSPKVDLNPNGPAAESARPLAVVQPKKGWRPSLKLIIFLALAIGIFVIFATQGHEAFVWLEAAAQKTRTPGMLATLCVIYAVLLAIPGVPGLEVGLVMMGVYHEVGIVAVWLCTIAGLNLSFFAGRKLPKAKVAGWLRPKNPGDETLVDGTLGGGDSMTLLLKKNRVGRAVLRWTGPPGGWRRYVLIAFLLNMPGNFVIGGGGGIGLFCGTSEDIKWPMFLATTVVAAAAIPAMFYAGLLTVREVLPT